MNGTIKPTDRREPTFFEIKFIIIPRFLAFLLHTVMLLAGLEYCALFIAKNPTGSSSLVAAAAMMVIYVASKYNQGLMGQIMVRKRLWIWGRTRFSTWDELKKWFVTKSPQDIETILITEAVSNKGVQILEAEFKK